MKKATYLLCFVLICLTFSCIRDPEEAAKEGREAFEKKEQAISGINTLLDSLNIAAAKADFKTYFSYFTSTSTYNGTDATENWNKQTFMEWAKPYFDAKTTWNFKSIKRNIYFGKHDDIAWFEELLSTQMKICRGSGVVIKLNGKWKIEQYVLSMTIPNSQLDKVIATKSVAEDPLLNSYKK